ncbi:leucine-rich repeat extensin-like protein 4 [Corylus avellana]|uniref:leucine-rich repeat extensin-like protein 4 n=1 Tax=Corylus avellana TaxID=13451 RepID=UPI00286D4327|nr:leucine-rich repeat extensin-like protein 4 [Corylus avellana]
MGTISFFAFLLLSTFLLHSCFYNGVDAGSRRKALETPSEAPSAGGISPRVLKFYPIVQDFKKRVANDPKGILKTWDPNDKNKGEGLTLDGFIEKLTDITTFPANSNGFTGGIPKEISAIPYFFVLDLSNKKLSGQFPQEILGAKKLTYLDLWFNSLSGAVPLELFTLDVDTIFLNGNNFDENIPNNIGCLPPEIGSLANATVLEVSGNSLTGPESFQCLADLEKLNLAKNQLYGSVPDTICKITKLAQLDLSDNYFSEICPECTKLIAKKVVDPKLNCINGLPNQRPKVECDAFLSKPKSCLAQNTIPCK